MDSRIAAIRDLPSQLRAAIAGLTDEQLDTTYRDGGWTLRQVVHHIADSHLHAYIRAKFILTEDHPTLKPYDQDIWAELSDSKSFPIESSLAILDGMHVRLTEIFLNASPEDMKRTAYHPEEGEVTLDDILKKYSGHGAGHMKQITDLRTSKGW